MPLLLFLGRKGPIIQQKRFVGTAIHQAMSNTEIECRDRLQRFRKLHEKYMNDVPYQSNFFVSVWYAHRAFDTLVATFQTLIDSIEDTDEKDRVLCEYQPRMEQLKRKFSDELESLKCRSGGGDYPLGVPRTNQSILYLSFSPESTIEERLEEFDFMVVRAWDDCTAKLVTAGQDYIWFYWYMAATQKASNDAEKALEKLFDGIDDPEETKRLLEEYNYFIWLVKNFASERDKFPWSKQSASNFNRALVQERLPWKKP
jgi:hypothetical protein